MQGPLVRPGNVTRVGPVHPAIGDFRVHCDRYRNEYIIKIQDDAFEVIVR